jgi:hypothetical protein
VRRIGFAAYVGQDGHARGFISGTELTRHFCNSCLENAIGPEWLETASRDGCDASGWPHHNQTDEEWVLSDYNMKLYSRSATAIALAHHAR